MGEMPLQVLKRDGTTEPYDPEKVNRVALWACEEVANVSASQLVTKLHAQLYNKIKTMDIHERLIQAAVELISETTPNYQWVAARLRLFQVRKLALGQYEPMPLIDLVKRNAAAGFYTPELLEWYTPDEFESLNKAIKHDRDLLIASAGMEQFKSKYLVQDRTTKEPVESPQFAMMLIAATLFHKYPEEFRLKTVKEFYNELSTFTISLPTPIMAGVRTGDKQFSSCVVIEAADSLDSISATTDAIVKYASRKAGIGIEGGHIRGIAAKIRGGKSVHTGVTPFYRLFESAVKSCSQGSIRNGSATLHAPIWHWEIESILSLKNNQGTADTRVRRIDYSIQTNAYIKKRLITTDYITLFSPEEVPELHEAFFADQELFAKLYEEAERKTSIRKKRIASEDLQKLLWKERKETGRNYIFNADNVNTYGPYDPKLGDPVRMSNLCQEIAIKTKPLMVPNDPNGLIGLCTLAAINIGEYVDMSNLPKLERRVDLLVRALNELLDYQDYPLIAAEKHSERYRPLGLGIINLAYWLAARGATYTGKEAIAEYHQLMEAFQYYALKASMTLAKERGAPVEGFYETRYSQGQLPIDWYNKNIDTIVAPSYHLDWTSLREDIKTYGLLNTTLTAQFPAETSAQVSNSTNGIEPVRALVTIKGGDNEGSIRQVVPHIHRLKNRYELLWDQRSIRGYLDHVLVMQKFFDQGVSTNASYNPAHYPKHEIPLQTLIADDLYYHKHGGKTFYYLNTYDGAGEDPAASVAVDEEGLGDDEASCDSCTV